MMATISYIQEHNQSAAAMKAVIDYCQQEKKVYDSLSGRRLVSGVNCDGENAYKEFMATKKAYHKADGMFFYQYTQSFSPKENITPEQAHEIALEFAEKAWQGYEVMVATHSDRDHIHSHFVINSVGFEDGLKLRQSPNTLRTLRKLSDEICELHGLAVLKPYDKSGMKIGRSTDVKKRVKQMQTANEVDLILIDVFPKWGYLEKDIHDALKERGLHLNGEWYKYCQETYDIVAEMCG